MSRRYSRTIRSAAITLALSLSLGYSGSAVAVDALTDARLLTTTSPAYRSLVVSVAALRRLGYDWDAELLLSYARLMHEAAVLDLDFVETRESEAERIETAVLGAILVEPMLQALHRLAQEEESARRYGFE